MNRRWMNRRVRGCASALMMLLASVAWTTTVFGDDKGQPELDKATELQLNAETLNDLEKVVDLAEMALSKGLGEENKKFAKQLISSTLYDHARRLSEVVLEQQPPNPRWPVLRGVAVKDLDKALLHDPDNAEVHLLRAKLLALPGGDRKEGMRSAGAAVKLLKDEKDLLSEAYVVRAALNDDVEQRLKDLDAAIDADSGNADAWQARAMHYLSIDENEKAVADLKKLVETKGDNVMARLALAEALTNVKEFDEALKQVDAAIAKQPDVPLAYLLKARVQLFQEKIDEALASLGKAIEIEPRDVNALLMRAQLLIEKEKADAARNDLDRVLQLQPGLPQALLLRSAVYVEQKKYRESISDLRELLKKSPDNEAIRLQAAQVYVAGGWPRHAIRMLSKIIEDDGENWMALRARGDAYLNIGKHAEAIADFTKAHELQPENSGLLNNFAWVLATTTDDKLRDADRSIKLATKACELTDYKQSHILSTLASGYAEKGEFETAVKWSTKAVELGEGETKDALKKELESYQQKKAWREKQEAEEKPNPPPLDESLEL